MSQYALPAADGPWVEKWLSQERLSTYLHATASRSDALALYEWNTDVSAAIFRDLCAVEIALRNTYDRAIQKGWRHAGHWTEQPDILFPKNIQTRSGAEVDVNTKSRELLKAARNAAGGASADPGKVVAELSFGFWRYLSTRGQEKGLWVPFLHRGFPRGTDRRRDVDNRVQSLHRLRNRIAHHEPLIDLTLTGSHRHLTDLAALLDPDLGAYVRAQSTVPALLRARPATPNL